MNGKIRRSVGDPSRLLEPSCFRLVLARDAPAVVSAVSATSRPTAYDASRETTLQGTVVSYTEESSRAPIGARATIQTAKGTVDMHARSRQLSP